MTPYVDDPDFTLYLGDVTGVLEQLPAESVHCVVTSPPYWGLRDYGTGSWDGGDAGCDHTKANARQPHERKASTLGGGTDTIRVQEEANVYRDVCGKCGATRVDRQLGLEPTPDEYVARMVAVFREVRRVLRRDGTCWVNLGDSYANDTKWGGTTGGKHAAGLHAAGGLGRGKRDTGLKAKDLVGIPWRVAFALQQDGWYLRADIIWSKPNPMPESVTDRPTKAHEYVFLLSKQPRYFFDQEAVRESWADDRNGAAGGTAQHYLSGRPDGQTRRPIVAPPNTGRNVRSVWEIATQPYAEAHFATFPEELARRCILAGCPEWVCGTCGKPRERLTADTPEYAKRKADLRERRSGMRSNDLATFGLSQGTGAANPSIARETVDLGWSDCGHQDYRPGVVLDPFLGSGTVAKVARDQGRRSVGVELNPAYAELAARRLSQLSLLA